MALQKQKPSRLQTMPSVLLDNTSREAQKPEKEAMMQTREEIHKLREDVEKEIVNEGMNFRNMSRDWYRRKNIWIEEVQH